MKYFIAFIVLVACSKDDLINTQTGVPKDISGIWRGSSDTYSVNFKIDKLDTSFLLSSGVFQVNDRLRGNKEYGVVYRSNIYTRHLSFYFFDGTNQLRLDSIYVSSDFKKITSYSQWYFLNGNADAIITKETLGLLRN